MSLRSVLLASGLAAAAAAPVSAAPGGLLQQALLPATGTDSRIADQYIVLVDLAPFAGLDLNQTIATLLAAVGGGSVLATYEHALTGFAVRLTAVQAELLQTLPGVLHVEPDQTIRLDATQANPGYNLDRTDQRNLPLDQSFTYPDGAGQGVHVYVIDTGINPNHVDFTGRIGTGRNFAPDGGGLLGGGTVDPNNVVDCNGHGTHVSGTAMGTRHGVAKSAIVHPVRVFGCGNSSSNSVILAGIDWTTANHIKPAVANLSLGGGASTATDTAVRNLVNAGVVAAVAAGNDNSNACNYSPAREPTAITVGSTTSTDARSSFSNFGTCLDLYAPGSSIVSASSTSNTGTATLSGTSMASPLVAGVAAVYLGQNPAATPQQVRDALVAAATPNKVSDARPGSPNLLLYLEDSGGGGPVDAAPVARFTATPSGLTVAFDGSGSSDDQGIAAYSWTFGDGSGGNGAQLSHSYAAAGSYSVTLTVTDTVGQTDSETQTVTVTDPSVPTAPCTSCTRYTGTLATGGSAFHPGSGGYSSNGGVIRGYLRGPAGSDYELILQQRSGFLFSTWTTVATADGPGASEDLSYTAAAGTYRFRVRAKTGSGAYEFYLEDN
ncbi:MAG TPA: S8 family serine peptidase [Nevskiaceae bacterium]|nr:S8 family serine peptidase [Nevskiaceae bacterium]